jgi:hypothetical protein
MQHIFKAIYSSCAIRQTAISTNPNMLQAYGLLNRCKHYPYSPCQYSGSRLALYLQAQNLLGTLPFRLSAQCWARKCFENTSRASPMTPCKLCLCATVWGGSWVGDAGWRRPSSTSESGPRKVVGRWSFPARNMIVRKTRIQSIGRQKYENKYLLLRCCIFE